MVRRAAVVAEGRARRARPAAAVLAVVGGTLVAPPLDGRILPSVTRTVALRRARAAGVPVAIRPLLRDEMGSASELILASALRGIRASGASGPGHSGDRGPAPVPVEAVNGALGVRGDRRIRRSDGDLLPAEARRTPQNETNPAR